MKTTKKGKLGRLAMSIVAALAIVTGVGVSIATSTADTHAAIKWGTGDGSHGGNGNAYGHFK